MGVGPISAIAGRSSAEWLQCMTIFVPFSYFATFSQVVLFWSAGLWVDGPRLLAIDVIGTARFGLALLWFRHSMTVVPWNGCDEPP